MVRCFLTGVQLQIDQALVLDRRAASDLLQALQARAGALQRIIDQFGPLDEVPARQGPVWRNNKATARPYRQHRLACPVAADALAAAYPETQLFIKWTDYRARVRQATQQRQIADADAEAPTPDGRP